MRIEEAGAAAVTNPLTDITDGYSMQVRDAAFTRLKLMPYFRDFKTFRKVADRQMEPEDLPYAAAYLMAETAGPDGDPNVGNIRFIHDAVIGFSVIIRKTDSDTKELELHAAYCAILSGLLCDPTFTGFFNTPAVEGFPRITRDYEYGTIGSTNQTPAAELKLRLSFRYRSYFDPVITDDFRLLHFETRYPTGKTEEELAKIQQIIARWDIPQ